MIGDSEWNRRIVKAQNNGRAVKCYSRPLNRAKRNRSKSQIRRLGRDTNTPRRRSSSTRLIRLIDEDSVVPYRRNIDRNLSIIASGKDFAERAAEVQAIAVSTIQIVILRA